MPDFPGGRIIRPLLIPDYPAPVFTQRLDFSGGYKYPPFFLLGLKLLLLSLSSIVDLEKLALSLYPSMILAPI